MSLTKFKAIVSGFANYAFPNQKMEAIAKQRANTCSKCPHADPDHPFKKWIPEENRIEEIKGLGCKVCGCMLSAKVRQMFESCPEKKWS